MPLLLARFLSDVGEKTDLVIHLDYDNSALAEFKKLDLKVFAF
jgi:hypothetical protein